MKFKGTWILLLIFLALAAYLFLVENPKEKKEAERKEKSEKLFDFSADQVQQVELDSTKGHFLIQKNPEGKWMVKNLTAQDSGSIDVPADLNVVERMIREIQEFKPARVVDEKGEDLKSYGFNLPEKAITLTLKDKSGLKLLLGDDAPLSETVYVKRGDSGKVFLSDSRIKLILEYDFWNLRNKHLLSYDQILIDRVEVKKGDQSWELSKKGEEWVSKEEPNQKINEEKLSSFLFSVGTLEGDKVLNEEGKNLKEYGLDPPYAAMSFHIKDKVHTLLIGKMKKEEMITALGNPAGPVFEIKKAFIEKIPSKEDLIKKEPFPSPAPSAAH